MPNFKIQGPDGNMISVTAPDGQTALSMAQQQYASRSAKASPSGLFGDKQAPGGFGGMVADSIGAKDPAYQAAMAREQAKNKVRPQGGMTDHVVDPFTPYASGAAAFLGQGTENLYRSATGQPIQIPAATAYQAAADNDRARNQQWAQQHPGQAFGAGVLSMFATPDESAPVRAGAGMLSKLRSAAVSMAKGAGIGGVYGAADAPDGHHLEGAGYGAATGALTTGALMAGGKLLRAAGKPAVDVANNRLGPKVVGSPTPKPQARQAMGYVANKTTQSGVNLRTSTAPTAAEAMGNTGRVALAALARQSGQTPEATAQMLSERRAGRPDRILDTVSKATGIDPAGAKGSVDAIIQKGQAGATPLFDAVRATPGPVWNEDLARWSQTDAGKRSLAAAYKSIGNDMRDPTLMGLKIDPDTGKFVTEVDPNSGDLRQILEPQPTAEAWEEVRQRVGDLGKESPTMSNSQRLDAQGAQNAYRHLTRILAGDANGEGALIPGYRDALNVAGDYKSVEGAFNSARGKLFAQKFTPADLSDMMDGISPAEQNAVRHAIASDMYDASQNGLLTLNRVQNPAVRAKLTLAFGQDAAGKIGDTLANEAQQAAAEQQILPQAGSQTAPLAAEMRAQQENPLGDFAVDAATGAIRHGLTGVAEAGLKAGMKSFGAAMKTPGMGTQARDEAGRLLMMSPDELADYLSANKVSTGLPTAATPLPFIGGRTAGALVGAAMPQQAQAAQ